MRELVSTMEKNGFNIVIDDVALDPNAFLSWKAALKDYTVLWIGLTAPIEIIEKRERERGDRQIGQGRATALQVHTGFEYDLFLDTSANTPAALIQKIKEACQAKKLAIKKQSE